MRQFSFFPLVLALATAACVHKPDDQYSDELNQLQGMASQQVTQVKQVAKEQKAIARQLQVMQTQLQEQQQLLAAKPQVIERITRVECPAPEKQMPQMKPTQKAPEIDMQVVGLRETILLTGVNMLMPAKISPQLPHSVLDARNIQMFERNSSEWVRFTLLAPETKEPHVLERKLVGFQTLSASSKTTERRPVVEIKFTLGKLTQKGEFILADRSHSAYPVLVARNLLRDVMLVDVSGENIAPPEVNNSDEKAEKNPEPATESATN